MLPHEVLGVPSNASQDEIRRAYRIKAQLLHPDRHATASDEVREAAAEEFRRVVVAYEALSSTRSHRPADESPGAARQTADRESTGEDQDPEGTFLGADAEDLIEFVVAAAAEAHPDYRSDSSMIRSYAESVRSGAMAQLASADLPRSWSGIEAVGKAHMALYRYMDHVAKDLAQAHSPTRNTNLYLIAFNACGLLDHVTEPPPGLPQPVPLSARATTNPSWSTGSSSASTSRPERLSAGRAFWLVAAVLGLIVLLLSVAAAQQDRQPARSTTPTSAGSSATTLEPRWELGACIKPVAGQPELLEPTPCSRFHTGKIISVMGTPEECPPQTAIYVEDMGFIFCIEDS